MGETKSQAYRLTIRAILMAIILIQGMVPFLGYIPLGPVSLTIIHLTVIVAAVTLGTKDGMFVGLICGLTTLVRAWTSPTSPLDTLIFTNPIVSVLPRVMVGLVAGVTFTLIYKRFKKLYLSTILAAIFGTLTNTILVLGLMGLLYTEAVAQAYETTASGLFTVLAALVITNGVPEVIGAAVITPLIVRPLFTATKLRPDNRG